MAKLSDGREVPDHYDDIGVLAPGGGTRGITAAGAAELTRQRFANTSLPTRALGMALGAAETLVPPAGSPKETIRSLAKAARDYIVTGQDKSLPGFATLGAARQALSQGYAMGTVALAGDPKAQGAALAALAAFRATGGVLEPTTPVSRHPMTFTPSLEASAAAPGVLEAQATRAARRILDKPSVAASSAYDRMVERRAQRLAPPDYTGPKRRAVDVVNEMAELARKRQAELEAQGFLGMGPESMTPQDVVKTKIIGQPEGYVAGTILPNTPKEILDKAIADFNAVDWDAADATLQQRAGVPPEGVIGKITPKSNKKKGK